jgi:hypothetical protein
MVPTNERNGTPGPDKTQQGQSLTLPDVDVIRPDLRWRFRSFSPVMTDLQGEVPPRGVSSKLLEVPRSYNDSTLGPGAIHPGAALRGDVVPVAVGGFPVHRGIPGPPSESGCAGQAEHLSDVGYS